jgi:hypothetical protein
LYGADPNRININTGDSMLKKLLVALIASAFAMGVYAQAPKSGTTKAEPKGQTGVTTEKAEPGKGAAKADPKAAKKAKTKAKKGDAKADVKKDAKAK